MTKYCIGLVLAILVTASTASAAPTEGVAWGTSRRAARQTCYANTPGGITVVRRGADGNFYGTRKFGPGAYFRAASTSRTRAATRTRGHLR